MTRDVLLDFSHTDSVDLFAVRAVSHEFAVVTLVE